MVLDSRVKQSNMNTCIPTPSSVHAVAGVCKTESPDDVEKCCSFVLPCESQLVTLPISSHFIKLHWALLILGRLGWALLYFWTTVSGTFTLGITTFSGDKTGYIANSYCTCGFCPPLLRYFPYSPVLFSRIQAQASA